MRLLIRCVLALSVVVLGLTMVMGDAPTVRANLEHCDGQPTYLNGFGGGGGYCPPEYSTCEDEDGDGCFDIDIGGGGGGGDWVPIPTNCLTTTNQTRIVTSEWRYTDYGLCASQAQCEQFRDRANVGRPLSGPRWHCWSSAYAPETSGRNLVFGYRYVCVANQPSVRVPGWQVTDLGDCGTPQWCQQKASWLNAEGAGAHCWAAPDQPGTAGQHLVLARPRGALPPSTTLVTLPPDTLPPDWAGDVILP